MLSQVVAIWPPVAMARNMRHNRDMPRRCITLTVLLLTINCSAEAPPTDVTLFTISSPKRLEISSALEAPDGSTYITGRYEDELSLGATTYGDEPGSGLTIFIAKLSSADEVLWSRIIERDGSSSMATTKNASGHARTDVAMGMALDSTGDLVITGALDSEASADFGGGPVAQFEPMSLPGAFVAKYSPDGALRWAHWVWERAGDYRSVPSVPVIDGADNIIFSLDAGGDVDLGGGPITISEYGLFKLDPAGEVLFQRELYPANNEGGFITCTPAPPVAVTGDARIFVSTMFQGIIDLGMAPIGTDGAWESFLAEYSSDGELLSVHSYPESVPDVEDSAFQARTIAVTPAGDVVLSGEDFVMSGSEEGVTGGLKVLTSDGQERWARTFHVRNWFDQNGPTRVVDMVVSRERFIAVYGSNAIYGYDFDGELVWQHDYGKQERSRLWTISASSEHDVVLSGAISAPDVFQFDGIELKPEDGFTAFALKYNVQL